MADTIFFSLKIFLSRLPSVSTAYAEGTTMIMQSEFLITSDTFAVRCNKVVSKKTLLKYCGL